MGKERIAYWDNVRALLIFFVVIGHLNTGVSKWGEHVPSVFLFIYTFHMPAFFLVSGLFHRNKNIVRKMSSYLGILVALKCLLYLTQYALGIKTAPSLISTSATPWFIGALAFCIGLEYLIRDVDAVFVLAISVVSALMAGFDKSIGSAYILSRILYFFPFYHLGTMIPRERAEKLAEDRRWKILGAAVILLWFAVCMLSRGRLSVLGDFFVAKKSYAQICSGMGPVYRMLAYAISLVTSAAVILCVPCRHLSWFSPIGARTIQIYFWHRTVIYIIDTYVKGFFPQNHKGALLWMLLGIPMTYLLSMDVFQFPTNNLLDIQKRGRWKSPERKEEQ